MVTSISRVKGGRAVKPTLLFLRWCLFPARTVPELYMIVVSGVFQPSPCGFQEKTVCCRIDCSVNVSPVSKTMLPSILGFCSVSGKFL